MPSLSLSNRYKIVNSEQLIVNSGRLLLLLFTIHYSLFSMAKPSVLPEKTAAHFCQLFVSDNSSLSTLSRRAHQMIQLTEQRAPSELARRWSSRDGRRRSQPDDSLSVEQIFAGYVLLADGWQTMRLFPHQENGAVSWYSATDELPASIGSEHQKYIREVFPRLVAEVQLGHWSTVDAYIDRMIKYQCQFGGQKLPPRPSSAAIIGIFLLFLALIILGIIKSIFTLGIPGEPASFNSFLLFKKFTDTPKG